MNPSDSDASRLESATADRRGEQDLDDLLVHVAFAVTTKPIVALPLPV